MRKFTQQQNILMKTTILISNSQIILMVVKISLMRKIAYPHLVWNYATFLLLAITLANLSLQPISSFFRKFNLLSYVLGGKKSYERKAKTENKEDGKRCFLLYCIHFVTIFFINSWRMMCKHKHYLSHLVFFISSVLGDFIAVGHCRILVT